MNDFFPIPQEFVFPPSYEKKSMILKGDIDSPFYYDIANVLNLDEVRPWKKKQRYIPQLFSKWKESNRELTKYYGDRDRKSARPIMISMVALLFSIIYWTNDQPVKSIKEWDKEINELTYKPVNTIERLSFILKDPDHFHSYNQLKSLFEEVEKIYYKSMVGIN